MTDEACNPRCSICNRPLCYDLMGLFFSAHPINDGVCCVDCTVNEVVPFRVEQERQKILESMTAEEYEALQVEPNF